MKKIQEHPFLKHETSVIRFILFTCPFVMLSFTPTFKTVDPSVWNPSWLSYIVASAWLLAFILTFVNHYLKEHAKHLMLTAFFPMMIQLLLLLYFNDLHYQMVMTYMITLFNLFAFIGLFFTQSLVLDFFAWLIILGSIIVATNIEAPLINPWIFLKTITALTVFCYIIFRFNMSMKKEYLRSMVPLKKSS